MSKTESIADKKWLSNEQIVKGAIGLVAAVGIWYRMEMKFDEAQSVILKKIDEHILSDGFEKKAMQGEITELRQAINQMQVEAKEYFKNEYLRPEEPRIERRQRQ